MIQSWARSFSSLTKGEKNTMGLSNFVRALLVLFSLGCTDAFAAEQPRLWLLLGTHDDELSSGQSIWCADTVIEQRPLLSRSDYDAARQAFYAEFKGKSPSVQLLGPERATVVFTWRKRLSGFNCERQVVGVAHGATLDAAEQQMQRNAQDLPGLSPPQVVLRWQGRELLVPTDRSLPDAAIQSAKEAIRDHVTSGGTPRRGVGVPLGGRQ